MSDDLPALIRGTAHDEAGDALLGRLVRRSWPASSDTTVPAARDWVRRWQPRSLVFAAECGCAAGRCGVCN